MKTYLISFLSTGIFLSFLTSGTVAHNNHTPKDSSKSTTQKLSASDRIYGSNCINQVPMTGLHIQLSDKPVYAGDSVHGTAYLTSDGLKQLARCNNLNYESNFEVYADSDLSFVSSMKNDTATFTIPFGLLTPVKAKGYKNVYEFTAGMKTTFFKLNTLIPYDTTMVTAVQLQVKSK